MSNCISSDFHVGHKKIFEFCSATRSKFGDMDGMKQGLVDEVNSITNGTGTFYHLGDLYFGSNTTELVEFLSEIRANMVFIRGNHDSTRFVKVMETFGVVHDYLELKDNGKLICLMHYPLHVWKNSNHGSLHWYGHCHGRFQHPGRAIDVGYDAQGKVLTVQEAIDLTRQREIFKYD